jgi:hypothetical protein
MYYGKLPPSIYKFLMGIYHLLFRNFVWKTATFFTHFLWGTATWTGAENLAHTGIQSPDHPALSQSLYRLSYPTHAVDKFHPFYRPRRPFGRLEV